MSDLESVVINLRALLVSTKHGIPLHEIENEYYKLNGERILFKELGFSSLENLLNSTGFKIQNRGGVDFVPPVGTNKTHHLTELIKRQKSKPPKKKPFMVSKIVPRTFSSNYNRSNNFSRHGNNGSNYRAPRNFQSSSIPNHSNSQRISPSCNNSRSSQYNNYQSNSFDQNNHSEPQIPINNYSSNTDNYHGNHQPTSDLHLHERKPLKFGFLRSRLVFITLQQNNLLNDNTKNYVKSVPLITNNTHSFNANKKSYSEPEQKLPPTSSCSSLESTHSSSSSRTPKPSFINTPDKFQRGNIVNNAASQIVNKNDGDKIQKNNIYIPETYRELKAPAQKHIIQLPFIQNMTIKPSTAQSRLQKYPKKCDESLQPNKVDSKENKPAEESLKNSGIQFEDTSPEVIEDDHDYIDELESYLQNLNLPEPFYECMVKKEKNGKSIIPIHMCTVKVNDKSINSSFPIGCRTVDSAKQVAAKHTLLTLINQYGKHCVYPITNDINTVASRVKEFLKLDFEESGIMGEVLERKYREKFQEILPDNWIQLLEVYSYFTFDKLAANKVMIYLNVDDNNQQQKNQLDENGYVEESVEEQDIVPGTPLMLEDYEEKTVLVSANYGSESIYIRFVGQNADENFIQMQTIFNDTMNNQGFTLSETLVENEFYAVLYNSSWYRVQLCGTIEEDSTDVTCFMIDTGEQLTIAKNQICYLEPMFMKIKSQAITCVLSQLTNFGTSDSMKELLDEIILNKTFFLIPDSLEDGYTQVTLYEKKGTSDRVNVNNMIVQRFLEKTIAKLPSFEENAVVDGIVSAVDVSGYLYIQLNFDIVFLLEEILPNDECLVPEFFLKSKNDIKTDKVYITKYEDTWCRVKVSGTISDSEAEIIYIDYGNISRCEITNLADLDMFDPLMAMIPPQAIKVSMHLLPPSIMKIPDNLSKVFEIIGNERVLVNLIYAPTNDVPCVQLYKTQPDTPDIPLCINVQLAQSLKKQ